MSHKLKLSIAEPCHEHWDKMSATEQGRFCGSCSKQVVDFSSLNDEQIIAFFRKPATGSVCGRFTKDQLNRDLQPPRKRIPWLKYFFQMIFPAFFIARASAQSPMMGKVAPDRRDTSKVQITEEHRLMGMVATGIEPFRQQPKIESDSTLITIKGKVIDDQGDPIPFAAIRLKASASVVFADQKGEFTLTVPGTGTELDIRSAGFDDKSVRIDKENAAVTIQLIRASNISDLDISSAQSYIKGEVSFHNNEQRRTDSLNATDQVIQRDIMVPESQNRFSLYPNPVIRGTSISLGVQLLDEGYYKCQFITLAGQLINEKEIWIDKDARLLNIDVPRTAAGSYMFVLVERKSGKKFSEKISIQ